MTGNQNEIFAILIETGASFTRLAVTTVRNQELENTAAMHTAIVSSALPECQLLALPHIQPFEGEFFSPAATLLVLNWNVGQRPAEEADVHTQVTALHSARELVNEATAGSITDHELPTQELADARLGGRYRRLKLPSTCVQVVGQVSCRTD